MLTLYKNIKSRRCEIGMSQDELAKAAGYTDRSSIAKIEAGKIDLSQSKIEALAKALGVTASELMGWESPSNREHVEKALEISTLLESLGYSVFLRDGEEMALVVSFDRKIYYDIDAKQVEKLSNEVKSFLVFKIKEVIENSDIVQYTKKEVMDRLVPR